MERVSTHSLEEMSPTMECLWDLLPHTGPQWTIVALYLKSIGMYLESVRADVRMECGPLKY